MADIIGYYIPKFYNEALDDPLLFDSDPSGVIAVQNNIPPGYLSAGFLADAQNRLATSDGVNRPRPGKDQLAQIANCTRVNGLCQLSGTIMLIAATVSGAPAWYKWDGNVLTTLTGPSFNIGNTVYMTQGLNAIYFTWGSLINKWDGTTFSTIATNPGHPNYDKVIYFTNRLIGIESSTNIIDMSGFLSDSTWDTVNLSLQVDQFIQDSIVGACPYQAFNLVIFKHSSIYLVDCNPANEVITPTPSIANFPITIVSSVIGASEHRTICQAGNDVIFLSESGRGVFTVGQVLTNEQQALKNPISLPIKGYINRINWSAIARAHAIVWDDLYILSVPLDGSNVPNYLLIYNLSIQQWQGIWLGYNSDCFYLSKYSGVQTEFMFCDQTGNLYHHWYAAAKVFVDTVSGNIGSGAPYLSSFQSRAYRMGETFNKIQPFSWIVEFTESTTSVNVQLIADTHNVGTQLVVTTGQSMLSLPLNLPFDLPSVGPLKQAISARPCGICTEHQINISATGTWCVLQLSSQAWVARSNIIQQ